MRKSLWLEFFLIQSLLLGAETSDYTGWKTRAEQ